MLTDLTHFFPMIERLKLYIEKRGLLPSQFADALGMPRSSFSQLMNGRNKSISDVTIGKIHSAFPDLSIQWLLFGEGEMETIAPNNNSLQQSLQSQPLQAQPLQAQSSQQQQLQQQQQQSATDPHQQTQLTFFNENEIIPTNIEDDVKNEQEIAAKNVQLQNEIAALRRSIAVNASQNPPRKISKIMVFYSDNSFEIFKPE